MVKMEERSYSGLKIAAVLAKWSSLHRKSSSSRSFVYHTRLVTLMIDVFPKLTFDFAASFYLMKFVFLASNFFPSVVVATKPRTDRQLDLVPCAVANKRT
jgi:hypothetical protein